jgi:hypothetical protein
VAVTATVAVGITGIVLAVVLLRDDAPPPTGDATSLVQEVAAPVDGAPLRFRVPEEDAGWMLSTPETVTGFATSDGGSVTVTQPAYYLRGWCRDDPRWSSRGFVGMADAVAGNDVRAVNQAVAQRWTDALAWDGDTGARLLATVPEQRRVELGDGTRAWLSRSEVDLVGASIGCAPPRAQLWLLSLRVDGHVATLVAAVDVDVEHALTDDQVERILTSVEPAG